MSTTVDERVVIMEFDNSDFEKNVETSRRTLKNFKRELNFEDSADSFNELERNSKRVKLSGLTDAFDGVSVKINAWSMAANAVITKLVDTAVAAGTRIVKALTIDQVSTGWTKYEDKTTAIQTIMAALSDDIEYQGELLDTEAKKMQYVNDIMEQLTWFTDETSFSLTGMTDAIGKFVASGVGLEQAMKSMEGIATWAAIAGQNASTATHVMGQLAQSLGSGKVTAQDWSSVETANMATKEMKQILIDAGVAQGTLIYKEGKYYALKKAENDAGEVANAQLKTYTNGLDGAIEKEIDLSKYAEVTADNMRSTLSNGWLTSDVLNAGLANYGGFATLLGDLYNSDERFTTTMTKDWIKFANAYDTTNMDEKEKTLKEFMKAVGLTAEEEDTAVYYLDLLSGKYDDYGKQLVEIQNIKAKSESEEDIAAAEAERAAKKEELINKFAKESNRSYDEAAYYIEKLGGADMDLGRKAMKAAQETKKFSEVIDATKEAAATRWMNIFQSIFGDYLRARELWSDLSERAYDIFIGPLDTITSIFADLDRSNAFDILFGTRGRSNSSTGEAIDETNASLEDTQEDLENVYALLMNSYDALFGWNDTSALGQAVIEFYQDMTGTVLEGTELMVAMANDIVPRIKSALETVKEWAKNLVPSEEKITAFKNVFHSIFAGFGIIKTAFKYMKQILTPVFELVSGIAERLFVGANQSESLLVRFNKFFATSEKIQNVVTFVSNILSKIKDAILGITDTVSNNTIVSEMSKTTDVIDKVKTGLAGIWEHVKNIFGKDTSNGSNSLKKVLTSIENGIDSLIENLKALNVSDTIVIIIDTFFESLNAGVRVINMVLPAINKLTQKLKDFFESIGSSTMQAKITTIASKIRTIFSALRKDLTGKYEFDLAAVILDILDKLETPLRTITLLTKRVSEFMIDVLDELNKFLEAKTLMERFTGFMSFVEAKFESALDYYNNTFYPKFSETIDNVKETLTELKPVLILMSPVFATMLSILPILIGIQKIAITFRDALYSVSDVFGLYASAEARKYKSWALIVWAFAALVGTIAYAVYELKDAPNAIDLIKEIGKIIIVLASVLMGMEALANAMDIFRSWKKNLQSFEMTDVWKSLATMVLAITALVYVLSVCKIDKFRVALGQVRQIMGLAILTFVAVLLATAAASSLGGDKIPKVTFIITEIFLLIGAIVALLYFMDKHKIDKVSSVDILVEVLFHLGLFMAVLMTVSHYVKEDTIARVTLALLAVSVLIATLAGTLYLINEIVTSSGASGEGTWTPLLILGGICIGLIAFMAIVAGFTHIVSVNDVSKTLFGMSAILLSISTAIAILVGVVWFAEKYIKDIGGGAFIVIGALFSVLAAISILSKIQNNTKNLERLTLTLLAFTGTVAVLIGVAKLTEMLKNPVKDILIVSAMLVVLSAVFSGMVALTRLGNEKVMSQLTRTMWAFVGVIGALLGITMLVRYFSDLKGFYPALKLVAIIIGGLSLVMSGLVMLSYMADKLGDQGKLLKLELAMLMLLGLVAGVGGLAMMVNAIPNAINSLLIVAAITAGLELAMVGLVGIAKFATKLPKSLGRAFGTMFGFLTVFLALLTVVIGIVALVKVSGIGWKELAIISVIAVALAGIMAGLLYLSKFGGAADPKGFVNVVHVFSEFCALIVALGAVVALIKVFGIDWKDLAIAGTLAVATAGIIIGLHYLSAFADTADPKEFGKIVGIFAEFCALIIALGAIVTLIQVLGLTLPAIGATFAITGVTTAICWAILPLSYFAKTMAEPKGMLKLVTLFAMFGLVLFAVVELVKMVAGIRNGLESAAILAAISLGVLGLMVVLAALSKRGKDVDLKGLAKLVWITLIYAQVIDKFIGSLERISKVGNAIESFGVLLGISVMVLAMSAALILMGKKAEGVNVKNIKMLAGALKAFAASIVILGGLVYLFNYANINSEDIWEVVAIMASVSVLLLSLTLASRVVKVNELAALSFAIYRLTGMLLGIAALMFVMNKVQNPGKLSKLILVMIVGIAGAVVAMAAVAKYAGHVDMQAMVSLLQSLTIAIISFAAMMAIIKYAGIGFKELGIMSALMGVLVLMAAASAIIGTYGGAGLYAMSFFLISLSGSMLIFSAACALMGVAITLLSLIIPKIVPVFEAVGNGIIALLSALIEGIIMLMPRIEVVIWEIVSTVIRLVVNGILELLKCLNDKGVEIVDQLLILIENILDLLIEHIPTITEKATDLAVQITIGMIKGMTDSLPELLDAGVKFVIAFIGGLGAALEGNAEELWEAVRKLIRGILNVFLTLLGIDEGKRNKILDKTEEIMKSIGPTIAAKTTAVIQAVKTFCTNVWNTLKEKLINLPTKIKEKLNEAWESVKKKFTEWKDNFKENGKNIIMGLVNGVGEKVTALKEAFVNVGETAVKKFKEFFGIKSPSRLMAENGRYIDEGIIVGLEAYSGKVADASEDVGGGIVDAFSEAIATAANLVENGIDSEPTIRPVMDLSNIQNGMSQVGSLFDQSYSVDATGSYARSAAGYNRGASSDISGESNTTVTNNQDINNIFNISGEDPKAIAEEVSRILQQQIGRRNSVWA